MRCVKWMYSRWEESFLKFTDGQSNTRVHTERQRLCVVAVVEVDGRSLPEVLFILKPHSLFESKNKQVTEALGKLTTALESPPAFNPWHIVNRPKVQQMGPSRSLVLKVSDPGPSRTKTGARY